MKILIIGYGAMGRAFGRIWKKNHRIIAVDPNQPDCLSSVTLVENIEDVDCVLFAIKPQQIQSYLDETSELLNQCQKATFVTIAASLEMSVYTKYFDRDISFVRVMPNLAVQSESALLACYCEKPIDQKIISLFEESGKILIMKNEKDLDLITPLSGSGPGFFFAILESFEKVSKSFGFSDKESDSIMRQTFIGTAKLLQDNPDMSFTKLKEKVTSPKGITLAGLDVLCQSYHGIDQLIFKTAQKALDRAIELKKER